MSQKYGRLTVIGEPENGKVIVRCDCGKEKVVKVYHMKTGRSLSCGCLRSEMVSARRKLHGMTDTKEYRTWRHIKERCCNPNTIGYENYGGRGIKVCREWIDSFESFYADMGPCPPGGTIERDDFNGDYEPSNCRWATAAEQANNTRKNVCITHEGSTMTIAEWSKQLCIGYHTLYRRVVVVGEVPPHAFRRAGSMK